MKNLAPKLTAAELAIWRALRRTGPATARKAHETLRREREDIESFLHGYAPK